MTRAESAAAKAAREIAETHSWVAAAELPLTARQAKTADMRAVLTIPEQTKLRVIDAYCSACRRNYQACAGEPCPALTGNTQHLIGGKGPERKPRGRPAPAPGATPRR